MNRQQALTITAFMLIFVILFFGFDTKSNKQKALEKSRVQNLELISIERVITEALAKLPGGIAAEIRQQESVASMTSVEEELVTVYIELAQIWYEQGHSLISAHYADLIAGLKNDESSWSTAGTSYIMAAQLEKGERLKLYAAKKGREALENAVSLNPSNLDNKINLAISYVEVPSKEEPMKGILMLLDMNKQYPENTNVLLQLAKLALRTNQVEKAESRLLNAVQIDPELIEAHCLLYEIYRNTGREKEAVERRILCEKK